MAAESNANAASAAVSIETEKLQELVINHIDGVKMRKMFWDLSDDVDVEELLTSEAIKLLLTLTDDERVSCCKAALSLLSNRKDPRTVHCERILQSIFMAACKEGIIPLSDFCELIIMSTNFALTTTIDAEKYEYMEHNLHRIDYKGLRNILKLLVVERMQELPSRITHYQRFIILPVEKMLLSLIDRKLNLLPCLFTITELHRISSNSRAFLLPRVAKKFNEMYISFRPLTEMVTIIGRPWLYPIAAHVSFPLSTTSWRLEVSTARLHQRAHLPFRSEMFASQSALLYTLLRQPRGKDTLSYVMRQNTTITQRLQCDELLHMIILEAMSEMEKTDLRLDDPSNQYQWMNITHTVTFSLLHGTASFSRLLKLLYDSLSETVYRKGRDELMWVILQYVAVYVTKLSSEEIERVIDIYNLLYSDEQTWSGVDTDPLLFVRFLVPAAMWMHFYKKQDGNQESLPKPSESLLRQIQFLQERTADADPAIQNVADHNAVLAAVANAFSNEMPIFQKLVLSAVEIFLDGSAEEVNNVWHLPYGVVSFPRKTSLPLPLIDSLTFHARNHLFHLCLVKLTAMQNAQTAPKMPSPAAIETLVRLAMTTEFDYGLKQTLALLPRLLASLGSGGQHDRSRDLLFILTEIFSYRFVNFPLPIGPRINIILSSFSALNNIHVHSNLPLCSALEQLILRFWIWTPPQEMPLLCNTLIGKQGKLAALIAPANQFCETQQQQQTGGNIERQLNLQIPQDNIRCYFLAMLRAMKVTGLEMSGDLMQRCNNSLYWPLTLSRTFSAQLGSCNVDDGGDTSSGDEVMHRVTSESLSPEEMLMKFFAGERRITLLCVIYNLLCETKKIHPFFYSILDTVNSKEMTLMINKFCEYFVVIFKSSMSSDDQTFQAISLQMVSVLNDMVFTHHLLPFERLLLSLVMRSTDDRGTEVALIIVHTMISSFPDLRNRLGALYHFLPSNKIVNTNPTFFNKVVEYYAQYPEFTYREMENKIRRELQIEMGLRPMDHPIINPEFHLPIYYGNLAERILPVMDTILHRALEVPIADQIVSTLLMTFKSCYRYHPQPATFMYSTLYCLEKTLAHTARARMFVLEICGQLEERDGKYALLTPSFISDNHQLSLPSQFCQVLVDRILQSTNYAHQPPAFAYKDWRFAEMPPAGQALIGSCIELLASPHAPTITAQALIDLIFIRPLQQPYATINAVALILTALPTSFQRIFYEHIVAFLDSDELIQGDPSICFGSLESECFLLTENQLMTNLALGHAYLQHCNTSSLAALPEFVRDQLAPKLTTETQLIFVLRLVVPILQRFYDAKERNKQLQDLAVDVYKMTVKVNERVGTLKYEDTICDFLYHMKYMFVGDFVRNEAEQAIQRLSPSMREKLKYISHTPSNIQDLTLLKSVNTSGSFCI